MTFKRPSIWSNLSFFRIGMSGALVTGWTVSFYSWSLASSARGALTTSYQTLTSSRARGQTRWSRQPSRLGGWQESFCATPGRWRSSKTNKYPFQTRGTTHQHFCFNGKFLKQDLRRLYLGPPRTIKSSESLCSRPVLSVQCWKFEWSWKVIR